VAAKSIKKRRFLIKWKKKDLLLAPSKADPSSLALLRMTWRVALLRKSAL
jgi:hypothetical protein